MVVGLLERPAALIRAGLPFEVVDWLPTLFEVVESTEKGWWVLINECELF